MKKKETYPNILVISNNPFSLTRNNGKTLGSFFDEIPENNIAQLYFNSEYPQSNNCRNFFRITDQDLMKSVFSRKEYGQVVVAKKNSERKVNSTNNISSKYIRNSQFFRVLREIVWKAGCWETSKLNEWLDEFSPDVIFLCAGDSGFTYDIAEYIKKKYNAKLAIYITDDYVLPRRKLSIFWAIRRNFIFYKMKKAIQSSNIFFTISNKMREEYKRLFNKDSNIVMNMSGSMFLQDFNIENSNSDKISLIYTGGLHFKRYKTLNLLSRAISKYNERNLQKKAFLYIYSNSIVSPRIKKLLNVEGASKFKGSLDSSQVKIALNTHDIPVHVESFEQNSIESTKLSLSTKIPEYLSLGKPIIALGPRQIASMEYLKNVAYCINNVEQIDDKFAYFIENKELQAQFSKKSFALYKKNHDTKIQKREIMDNIKKIYNE